MTCNCGSGNASNSGSATQLSPAPDPAAAKAPDGTPIGQDVSKGGTVAAYGSPGGGGTGGGYQGGGTQHATGANANIPAPSGLGSSNKDALSKKYESRGDPGAYNGDKDPTFPSRDPGGPSYGSYQIATKPGTMNNFLNQLQKTDPSAYSNLQAAGGSSAALAGDPAFVAAWKSEAANNPQFGQDQTDFITATHYDPGVAKIQAATGLDINAQSVGVQQAYYSWGVQSPNGAPSAFTAALQGKNISSMSQQDIINTMYDARSASLSNTSINSSVQIRLNNERQDALSAAGTPTPATKVVTNTQTGI